MQQECRQAEIEVLKENLQTKLSALDELGKEIAAFKKDKLYKMSEDEIREALTALDERLAARKKGVAVGPNTYSDELNDCHVLTTQSQKLETELDRIQMDLKKLNADLDEPEEPGKGKGTA